MADRDRLEELLLEQKILTCQAQQRLAQTRTELFPWKIALSGIAFGGVVGFCVGLTF